MQARKAAKSGLWQENATAAAKYFGWEPPTYLSHENGTRGFGRDKAIEYSQKFKVSLDWLLTGKGSMDDKVKTVPLGGYIGAGAEVYPIDDTGGRGLEDVEAPPDASPDCVAYVVRGDSMYPAYMDGDLVYIDLPAAIETCLNLECVIDHPDGRRLLKVVTRGLKKGSYTLISHNAPPIQEVRLSKAYPVTWVKRRGRHTGSERRSPDLPIVKFKGTKK